METSALLRTLSEAVGVAGSESGVLAAAREELLKIGKCEVSPLGSLICKIREPKAGGAHVMLDAHLDEIGLIVTAILPDGFLKVSNCGGIDRRILPACQVTIHGREPLKAVVCSVPPHLQDKEQKKTQKIEEFTLDAGLGFEAAQKLIAPGDRVTIDAPFAGMLGGRVTGKSLDNRAGCAAVMRAGELLAQSPLDCGLSVVLSSLEEVGEQGAQCAAYALAPTHAIVVDVSFAGAPGLGPVRQAAFGSGAMVGFAPTLCGEMSRGLIEPAKRHQIPHTPEVMGGKSGTNADNIAASRCGVRTALLSIPQRNMHTPVEIVDTADIEAVANLIAAYLCDNFSLEGFGC